MCTPHKTKANSSLLLDAQAGPSTCKLQIAALSRPVVHAARAQTWSNAPSQLPVHFFGLIHIKSARVWHGFPGCHRICRRSTAHAVLVILLGIVFQWCIWPVSVATCALVISGSPLCVSPPLRAPSPLQLPLRMLTKQQGGPSYVPD